MDKASQVLKSLEKMSENKLCHLDPEIKEFTTADFETG
jgi:hypothetical protein